VENTVIKPQAILNRLVNLSLLINF